MITLYTQDEFENARSRDMLPLRCEKCSGTFYQPKNQIQTALKGEGLKRWRFCSHECRNAAHQVIRIPNQCDQCGKPILLTEQRMRQRKERGHKHVFCSKSCSAIFANAPRKKLKIVKPKYVPPRVERVTISCAGCGIPVERTHVQLKKAKHGKPYCSKACRMRHYNVNSPTIRGYHKSRAETMLVKMIRNDFPTLEIRENARDVLPSHLELDIYLPSCSLAIELNGPVHFIPIYGQEVLDKTRSKDVVKQDELQKAKIAFFMIDISKLKTDKATHTFLSQHYAIHIKPWIKEATKVGEAVGIEPT